MNQTTLTSSLLLAGRQWRRLAQVALAGLGISEARASALIWVGRLGGGVRQVTLAHHIGIEGTSLVRLLDELTASGYLMRKDDPADRRAKTVWLTDAGVRLAEGIEAVLATLRTRVLRDVNPADIEATLRVFQAIGRASANAGAGVSPREMVE